MLYYYINLRPSKIYFSCSRDIYLSLKNPIVFEAFVILSDILFPIKSSVVFAVF